MEEGTFGIASRFLDLKTIFKDRLPIQQLPIWQNHGSNAEIVINVKAIGTRVVSSS